MHEFEALKAEEAAICAFEDYWSWDLSK